VKKASSVMDSRAQELLVERALGGLAADALRELEALGTDDDSFDLAAAAVALATLPREELPPAVAAKVLAAAGLAAPAASVPALPVRRRPAWRQPAWLVAAACLLLAIGAALWASRAPAERVVTIRVPIPPPPVPSPPSPAEARRELVLHATDVQQFAWTPTKDAAAAGVSGDVVWSETAQRGFMRFVGLAPNDPRRLQYQLWIFDQARDQAYPVDGGVFDVGAAGEIIVPITAKLAIARPALFAITIERPGGVVVSKREHIVVTAGPPA